MPTKIKTETPVVSAYHVTRNNTRIQRLLFDSRPDVVENVRRAIRYALMVLRTQRLGTIVYVNRVPIYHAESGWEQDPVAYYWKRKAGL